MKILIAITTHNRHQFAIRTIESLLAQSKSLGEEFQIWVSNSGSEKLAFEHPMVRTIQLSADSYWSSSNREIIERASNEFSWSHLFLINEDVEVSPDFLNEAVAALNEREDVVAVCGATLDESGKMSYGGYLRESRVFGLSLRHAPIISGEQTVATFNGNLVGIRRSAFEQVNGWPETYRHARADIVLGLRLSRIGSVLQLPGVMGTCQTNHGYYDVFSKNLTPKQRIQRFRSNQGYPLKEHLKFTREVGGWAWFAYFIGPYVRLLWSLVIRSRIRD